VSLSKPVLSLSEEKPELSPPPAMKSNQEAEQSPMDLTSV